MHEHVFALGERARTGLQALYDRLGVPAVVSGFGSVFVTYFLEGPVESYDDLLRNDVDLFVGYRRELMKHGIFELPLNLKRSHFSYAHTDDDVDRLLEATEGAVTRTWRRARERPRRLLHDRPHRSRQAGRAPRGPEDHEHRRLGVHLRPDRDDRERRRARRCSCSGGNHGDEYEGQVAALRLAAGARSRSRSTGA